jgi:hypothetical protein
VAGELAPCFGGHRGGAFVAEDGNRDVGVVERVEEGEVAFAGDAEDALDAVRDQRLRDEACSGLLLRHR